MYKLFRFFVFLLPAETVHHATLRVLRILHRLGLSRLLSGAIVKDPVEVMGLRFPNRVGLAAGLDKDGKCIDALGALGFGFLELGTVTPRPQPGNSKPRLFRLPEREAIINRMGFNNEGVEALVAQVRRARYEGVIGINIGKNFDTPVEQAVEDYLEGLRAVYPVADYVAVNISSPNTKGLRDLQKSESLDGLLSALNRERQELAKASGRRVPMAVKIAPDLDEGQIDAICALLIEHKMDAVIATNTTLSRDGVQGRRHAEEQGGLSGAPLRKRSTEVIAALHRRLGDRIPVIGVGGILSAEDANEKRAAGAQLVQIYSGLIYRGPRLVSAVASKP